MPSRRATCLAATPRTTTPRRPSLASRVRTSPRTPAARSPRHRSGAGRRCRRRSYRVRVAMATNQTAVGDPGPGEGRDGGPLARLGAPCRPGDLVDAPKHVLGHHPAIPVSWPGRPATCWRRRPCRRPRLSASKQMMPPIGVGLATRPARTSYLVAPQDAAERKAASASAAVDVGVAERTTPVRPGTARDLPSTLPAEVSTTRSSLW